MYNSKFDHSSTCFCCNIIACFKIFIYQQAFKKGLMVSVLDSGSIGPGSSSGQGSALCSWARHFTLTVPLSTQVYKWVPAILILRWTSIPSRGGVEILLVASCYGNRNKLRPDGPLITYLLTSFRSQLSLKEGNRISLK